MDALGVNGRAGEALSARGTGIADQNAVKSRIRRGACRGIDTHVRHHATHDKGVDSQCSEMLVQIRSDEGIGRVFGDYSLSGFGAHVDVELDTFTIGKEETRVRFNADMSHVHDGESRRAKALEKLAGPLGGRLDLMEFHPPTREVVALNIDKEEGSGHLENVSESSCAAYSRGESPQDLLGARSQR